MNRERTLKPAVPSGTGKKGFLRTERGVVIFMALLVMALLALLGATFLTMSTTESSIATNEVNMARAFNIAEAGLERAKTRIKTGPETNLDLFLTGTNPGPFPLGNAPAAGNALDGGNYIVRIFDNNDELLINNPDDDIDDRMFIESTGSFPNNPARKQILALVRVIKAPPMPATRGAAMTLANPGASSEIHAEPGSFDGRDWTPPVDVSTCSDINCGTKISDAGTYGGFSNLAAISWSLSNYGTMYGTGCLSQACAEVTATSSHQTDTSVSTTSWDPYIDAMIPRANQTLAASASVANNNTYTWGTQANPQITVLNVAGDLNWKANVTGAGVLIIEASPSQRLTFSGSGQLNWQGLVLIRSSGRFEFEVTKADTVRVFGVLVNKSLTQAEIELKQDGNFIKYSTAAVNMVNQNLGGTFQFLNWQEVAVQ